MSIPTSEPIPSDDETNASLSRQRRLRRRIHPETADERVSRIKELGLLLTPSFDFFLFTLVSGVILVAAILLDTPSFYMLAALFVPFIRPVLGISLASVQGSGAKFLQSIGALLGGGLVMFFSGMGAGYFATYFPGLTFEQASLHTRFTWPDFAVVTLGAALTSFLLLRSPKQKPLIPNVAMGYELFLPIAAAGFGLVSGTANLWPDGLIVFSVHLAWTVFIAILVMALSGFRPHGLFGFSLAGVSLLVSLAAFLVLGGVGMTPGGQAPFALAPLRTTAAQTATVSALRLTPSPNPSTTTPTATGTNTLVPTLTPSKTITPKPTPIWAKVWVEGGDGALIRSDPDSKAKIVGSVLNGGPIQVLSDPMEGSGTTWVRVRTESGVEGWIVQRLLVTATPAPNW